MTTSNEPFSTSASGPTTTLPNFIEVGMDFPELTTPQERYDRGFQRGYLAGYAEGARQAQAERAAELASHKAAWAATQARASSLVSQLSSAANEYLARWGGRDLALTEELMAAAFSVAESVVGCELRARPDRALEVARAALASLPPGPVIVRVHPEDEEFMRDATGLRSGQKGTEVLTDASVGRGGCVISCGGTTVDARVAEALARAKAAFCGAEEDQR